MKRSLRVGCVGAGYFSRFHYDSWARIDGAEPVASVNRDITKARATGLAAFDDLGMMLAEVRPDIVDIITPPITHLDYIRKAIEACPKAIICQKPFCLNLDEAHEAVRLSEAADIPVIVHENFRFQPWYRAIKVEIDRGAIGEILQLTFRLRPGDGQGSRAYLDRQPYFRRMPRFLVRETAVHWVDLFRFLMGEPRAVFADLRKLNPEIAGEDAGYILFSYTGGRRAMFDGNRLLDHPAENTRCTMGEALVEGSAGTIDLRGDGSAHLRSFGDQVSSEVLSPSIHEGFGGDCVHHLQSHVVQAVLGNAEFENIARDYLPVIKTENAIYVSAEAGTWVVL